MPPIIGTAIRCMISEPAPVLHMIGSRPAMIATTVIIFGRTRSTAPHDGITEIVTGEPAAFGRASGPDFLQGIIEVDQHHDAGFRGDAGERDKTDDDSHERLKPSRHISQSPTRAKGSDSITIMVSAIERKLR